MSFAFLTECVARGGRLLVASARGPRWDAAAPLAVAGMAVVAGAIVVGVLLFLRPCGRSRRGFAEPDESAPRNPFPWSLESLPDDYGQERGPTGLYEDLSAGRTAATSALVQHAAAPIADEEPPDALEAPDAPEVPEAPDSFGRG